MAMKRKLPMNNSKEPTKKAFWMNGLFEAMKDKSCIVEEDENVVVIKDGYPKARFHFLIMPKKKINNLNDLTKDHVDLLQHMEDVGFHLIKKEECDGYNFKMGFHAEPSLPPLHLHVISDDMDSVYLKNKKHWNSFTTDFFLDLKSVLCELQENGKVTIPSKRVISKLMDTPLKCHKCHQAQKNLPALKKHILTHVEVQIKK